MEIQHFCSRQHVLLLRDSIINNEHLIICEKCKSSVATPYYVCDTCKYYVHISCVNWPPHINHSFHPRHPLTLLLRRIYECDSCSRSFENTLCFTCNECEFDMDVECALMATSTTTHPGHQQHSIQHSSHPHLLLQQTKNINIKCFACKSKSPPSGVGVYYGCTRCEYFLHKQCMDQLPQQIPHPLHPHHGLLSLRARYNCRCSFCGKDEGRGLSFECPQCNFQLCVECRVNEMRRNVNCDGHEHPLCFMERIYTKLDQCDADENTSCKESIISNSNEFNITESSIFRCWDCDFKLHFLCGPLPRTVKSKCHVHLLILVDALIEDSSGEYYCDVCETERHPRIRVYYCDQCKYTTHVHCVLSEVINILKGDLRDVKLKMVGEDLWKLPKEVDDAVEQEEQDSSHLTLRDLIAKLDYLEKDILMNHFHWDEENKGEKEASQKTTQLELGVESIDEILRFSSFTEDEFNSFHGDLYHAPYKRKSKINSSDLEMKLVDVQGYLIPVTLVSVLKSLLHEYGDVSVKYSDSALTMKNISFFILCQVMKEMHSTLVINITKDTIHDWYCRTFFVRDVADFDVDFLEESLRRTTKAFFCLQVSKLDLEIPTILQKKIAEYKEILEKCEKFRDSSSKTEFIEKGLNNVMKLKWHTAGEVGTWFD